MTEPMAQALWFDDTAQFTIGLLKLERALEYEIPLSSIEWHRILAATEIAFASWILGAAGDWYFVSGIEDHVTLDLIRAIQQKLAHVRPWPEPYARLGHTGG